MACSVEQLFTNFGREVTWYRPGTFASNVDKSFSTLSVSDATVIISERATAATMAMGFAANVETGTVTIPAATAATVKAGDRFVDSSGLRRRLVGIGETKDLFGGVVVYEYESEAQE